MCWAHLLYLEEIHFWISQLAACAAKVLRLKQQYFYVLASLQDLPEFHYSVVDLLAIFLARRTWSSGSLTTACPSS